MPSLKDTYLYVVSRLGAAAGVVALTRYTAGVYTEWLNFAAVVAFIFIAPVPLYFLVRLMFSKLKRSRSEA